MPTLRIAEIFTSIQGEGIWAGTPSTFIRVSGCNLRCIWCDTPYASWAPEGPVIEVGQIVDVVAKARVNHVVITGGEPMLFDAVADLARELRVDGYTITIETAGTVHRMVECDLMSISPKLSNSTPGESAGAGWPERHEKTRGDLEPLKRLIAEYAYQLKFVVNPEADLRGQLEEIESVVAEAKAEPGKVLLMAEGTDSETLHRRERMLVETCIERGYRLTPRLHVDLFGNTRGT